MLLFLVFAMFNEKIVVRESNECIVVCGNRIIGCLLTLLVSHSAPGVLLRNGSYPFGSIMVTTGSVASGRLGQIVLQRGQIGKN